ncbi:MAG: hypothetical protein DWQ04_32900, partial [Chloroflexi bacterium]
KALATLIADLFGYQGNIIWDTTKPNGQPRRSLAPGRARQEFGWHAKVSLKEGLQRTIEWYQTHRLETDFANIGRSSA